MFKFMGMVKAQFKTLALILSFLSKYVIIKMNREKKMFKFVLVQRECVALQEMSTVFCFCFFSMHPLIETKLFNSTSLVF